MKNYFFTLLLSIVLMTSAFFGGYFFSKAMYENSVVLSNETNGEEVDFEDNSSEQTNTSYYLIRMENSEINIYEIESDGRRILIDSYALAEQLLPVQDRELLKSGIKVYNREEVFEIIENFVS